MVPLEPIPVQPRAPDPATIDPGQVVIAYDRRADTLVVDFFGRGRPSKIMHTSTGVDLRIDPSTEVIVGLQIEAVRKQAVDRHPLPILLIADLAELLGIRDDDLREIREIRNRIAHPPATRRHAAGRCGRVASLDERRRETIASLIEEALPMSA